MKWFKRALAPTAWCVALEVGLSQPVSAGAARWGADYFPDVSLKTQDGAPVKFYDLIKGHTVAIELIYTTCQYSCPLETARMAQVQKILGDRVGNDVFFLSITIDPDHDTPEVLKAYADKYNAGPGWYFLTGKIDDIDLLSKKLGLYTAPNPANKDGHRPMLLIGNEATGQWTHTSALDNPRFTAVMIGDWMSAWKHTTSQKSYEEAKPIVPPARGEYLFTMRCSACHAIGGGERIGPDLAASVTGRDPAWLARYIAAPDRMRAEGDPIATELLARYKDVRMPNLGINDADAHAIVDFVSSRAAAVGRPKSDR